jgi:hypothetical protein
LIGFVRTEKQLEWIKKASLYNLRADDRNGRVRLEGPELSVSFVLLYGPAIPGSLLMVVDGSPRVLDRQDLIESGYESPRGRLYFCLPLAQVPNDWSSPLAFDQLRRLVSRISPNAVLGTPVVTSWDALFGLPAN